MPDWRWVTEIRSIPGVRDLPPATNGLWVDFDGIDTIMPLPEGRYSGARTRLGWVVGHGSGWQFMFVTEQVQPITSQEAVS